MSNELEAIYAIGACVLVFAVSVFGVIIYVFREIKKQQLAHDLRMKILIESVIEIFESKYYGKEEDDDKGGISPGG